ncbi:Uncharacterised protein [Enterobacter cloacae]|nr:Uncharacterised protein [Enterobacter cloacae]
MTQNPSLFKAGPALIHVQVRPTNVGGGDADEYIRGADNFRIRYVFYFYIIRTVVNYCFHDLLLLACGKEMLPRGLGYQSSLAAITDLAIGERTIRMFLN